MTDFLILYGTTDGQTEKIAQQLANELRGLGALTDVVNAAVKSAPSPAGYRMVVVAASLHAGGYQTEVRQWVRRHATELADRPTAFVSVCLGVLQHDPAVDRELDAIMQRFFAETNWTPTTPKIVAGALPYTKYNLLKRLMMRRIVRKAHGDIDTTRDYEYTDWNDLAAFARTLVGLMPRAQTIRAAG
jgi:menaquinone-dependent protoporphyrinogen oxidase